MVVPVKFRKASESPIVSFDFIDVASGTGFITWYLGEMWSSTGAQVWTLATNTPYSRNPSSGGTMDKDFDTAEFNLPQTVKGTAYITLGVAATAANNIAVQAKLYKLNGVTETLIGSSATDTWINDAAPTMMLLEIPCTQTLIKKGEQIRLSISQSGTANFLLGHDPQGRDTGIITAANQVTSASRAYIPFALDL